MITILETGNPRLLAFKLSGKLYDADYQTFVPEADKMTAGVEGKLRLMVILEDFQGWDLHGAWDDFKFGMKHYADTERIALVGDKKWEEWMAKLWKPFSLAQVRYFETTRVEDAWSWMREGL